MIQKIVNIFRIPDLRRKILFTLFIVFIYRVGSHIPIPFIDPEAVDRYWASMAGGGGILAIIDMFSGRAFRYMTVFALGIMPYISASIILQLLMVVWPRLEKIYKEGPLGRKKIEQYTRYGTVLLSAFQSIGVALWVLQQGMTIIPHYRLLFIFTTMVAVTAGTTFIMWLGERITEKGIGNGISIIIMAGIVASYPYDIGIGVRAVQTQAMAPIWFPILFVLMIGVSIAIIMIQEGSRKIPIQHAKQVRGRHLMGGTTTYLPLKVNTGGVIPVIFSSAILSFPAFIFSWAGSSNGGILYHLSHLFEMQSNYNLYELLYQWFGFSQTGIFLLFKAINLHTILYAALTIFFCYFYAAITFNPVDVAENLKKFGSFIPGRRPGKSTSDYIDYILTRITLIGAIFLVSVALLPQILWASFNLPWAMTDLVGGTGLIIVVGVLLDTLKQIESQLLMRHYEGFKIRARGRGKW